MDESMDTKYLRMRRKSWSVAVPVPKSLWKKAAIHYGSKSPIKKEVVRGLGTRDLREACKLKYPVIAEIHKTFDALDRGSIPTAIEAAQEFDPDNDIHYDIVEEFAQQVADKEGYKAGNTYYGIATKQATPVSIHAEKWYGYLETQDLKLHTINDYKATINLFIGWSNDIAVQEVDRETTGLFMEYLRTLNSPKTGKPLARKTQKKKLTGLSRFWYWLDLYGFISEDKQNVWSRHHESMSKNLKSSSPKRALTKSEAQKWLKGAEASTSKYKQAMIDMLILGWHTGARASDLCGLTKEQILEDPERKCIWLHIIDGKTVNNERVMPLISTEAIEVIRRRASATTDGAIFYDVPPDSIYGNRYNRLQKTINTLRTKILKAERVDFHSLRRAFSVACEKAGADPVQWARMMGHSLPTLASAVYNRGHLAEKVIYDYITQIEPMLGELTDNTPPTDDH